jgi:hypothetical protein
MSIQLNGKCTIGVDCYDIIGTLTSGSSLSGLYTSFKTS